MQVDIRRLNIDDYDALVSVMKKAYPEMNDIWDKRNIQKLTSIFPDGQKCVLP